MNLKQLVVASTLVMCGVAQADLLTAVVVGSMLSGSNNNSSITREPAKPIIISAGDPKNDIIVCCMVGAYRLDNTAVCSTPVTGDMSNWKSPGAYAQSAGYRKIHKTWYIFSGAVGCPQIVMEVSRK